VTTTQFRCDLDEDRRLLSVHGELDEPATIELRNAISTATDELTSTLSVDLTEVTFMPSPAIGVLATSQAKARRNGADLVLVAPAGTIAQRLLTICALDHVETLAE
jgi:anti-anti-sigma factor